MIFFTTITNEILSSSIKWLFHCHELHFIHFVVGKDDRQIIRILTVDCQFDITPLVQSRDLWTHSYRRVHRYHEADSHGMCRGTTRYLSLSYIYALSALYVASKCYSICLHGYAWPLMILQLKFEPDKPNLRKQSHCAWQYWFISKAIDTTSASREVIKLLYSRPVFE